MKVARFEFPGGGGLGVVLGEEIADVRKAAPELATDPAGLFAGGPAALERVRAAAERAPRLPLRLNYSDHARETGREAPKIQTWFNKQSTSVNDPFAPILLPAVSQALDYEVELVVVIGRSGRHVPRSRAMEIVAGYACGCDYSVRDWQRATPTMIMGKGFDTHAPVGPWITTPDEIDDLSDLRLRCLVNGEVRQNGRAGDMIHDIPAQTGWARSKRRSSPKSPRRASVRRASAERDCGARTRVRTPHSPIAPALRPFRACSGT